MLVKNKTTSPIKLDDGIEENHPSEEEIKQFLDEYEKEMNMREYFKEQLDELFLPKFARKPRILIRG